MVPLKQPLSVTAHPIHPIVLPPKAFFGANLLQLLLKFAECPSEDGRTLILKGGVALFQTFQSCAEQGLGE